MPAHWSSPVMIIMINISLSKDADWAIKLQNVCSYHKTTGNRMASLNKIPTEIRKLKTVVYVFFPL